MSANDSALIPFTGAQRLIWLGQRLNPQVPLYNMAMSFTLPASLDVERFRDAWSALADECVLLRCSLNDDPASPGLVPGERPHLDVMDDVDAAEIATLHSNVIHRPFAPNEGLTRSLLSRSAHGEWNWLLVQHHLVTDLASFFVLFNRQASLYAGEGKPVAAFSKYVERERTLAHSEAVVASRDARVATTAGFLPAVDFLGRDVRIQGWRNSRYSIDFARTQLDDAPAALFGQDLQDYFVLLTALVVVLARHTGRARVVIGVPLHNRTNPSRKDTVGMLVEIVPLVVDVTVTDSLETVRTRVAEAFTSLMSSGSTGLVDERLAARFDVVVNYLQVPRLEFDGAVVVPQWLHCDAADPAHAMRLHVWRAEDASDSKLLFDCRNDTLGDSRANTLIEQYLHVLEQLRTAGNLRVCDVSLHSDSALRQFEERSAGTVSPRDLAGGLLAQIRENCERTPNAPALSDRTQTLDFDTLDRSVISRARALTAAGITAGEPVLVWRPRSIDAVIDILAVLYAGGAFVPVELNTPPERVRAIVADLSLHSGRVLALTEPLQNDAVEAFGAIPVAAVAENVSDDFVLPSVNADQLAYVLYTSGSTGTPKGVAIRHGAIHDYIEWARGVYSVSSRDRFGLFTSLGFDLTLTSLLLPLVAGASLRVYPSTSASADLAIADAVDENSLTFVKITPSHLAFWADAELARSTIRCWVVGGEQFVVEQAERVARELPGADVFNEYGPTEATVACMLHRYSNDDRDRVAVPIGRPADNHGIHVLDVCEKPVSDEIVGEIYISGAGVAAGYLNRPEETSERFVQVDGIPGTVYRTGDLARWNTDGSLEYIGRQDSQVKLSGVRFELSELDNLLLRHPGVSAAASVVTSGAQMVDPARHCQHCGLPDNYPDVRFSDDGVCSVCERFAHVRDDVMGWFRSPEALESLAAEIRESSPPDENNCAVLFSGGKDSTYMVYQLVRLGLKPVALSLDNGYLSKGAHENIRKVVQDLGIDHEYLRTPDMNRIFADSLEQFSNVCNGCFKTIYSLSMQYAHAHGLGVIFTGLSRGQLFETRLDDLFSRPDIPVARYDEMILSARKAYHRMDDVAGRCLGNGFFDDDACFERVRFEDFYRYVDVPLDDVYDFLENSAPWARPADTGRSTNCLINDAGIFVHRQTEGYHNYALPYAWDVRLGHKTRDQAIDELRDRIDTEQVMQTLRDVGFTRNVAGAQRLRSWVVGDADIDADQLREWLAGHLPANLLPDTIAFRSDLPLTANGKVDTRALEGEIGALPPDSVEEPLPGDERLLAQCWIGALGREVPITRGGNFFGIGGDSMAAILLVDEVAKAGRSLALEDVFSYPELARMATRVGSAILAADDTVDFGLGLDAGLLDTLVERNRTDSS